MGERRSIAADLKGKFECPGAKRGHRGTAWGGGESPKRLNFETVLGTHLRYLRLDSHVSQGNRLARHHLSESPCP